MSTISTLGFLNYYGMQRFGTAPIPTHVIGLALLQSNWALAAHLILRPREGEGEDVAYARQVCANGNFKEAAAIMPRRAVAEKASESKRGVSSCCTDSFSQSSISTRMVMRMITCLHSLACVPSSSL